ncbi:hypothetical protein DL546_002115 [Coniochaeta pulveracea]|uniref:Uncharacterized protein n=1 Tax=Coniochaeta pulveracea TaxID=177199 RepID=A0A420Y111_9PEZI|nr:hypothetical protein DL546_002115 [Coniochaeta pulveracea]
MKFYTLSLLAATGLATALSESLGLEKRVCPHDNLLRCLIATPSLAIPFCSSSVGVYPTASTVLETSTPVTHVTVTATAYSTSTSTSTVHQTDTVTTSITTSTTTTTSPIVTLTSTITVDKRFTLTSTSTLPPPNLCVPTFAVRYAARAAAKPTSLACISNLKPAPSAVASACSCFSGSYSPSIPAVTTTVTAETSTVTDGTVTSTVPVTVGEIDTVTEYTTITGVTTVVVTATSTCPSVTITP